MEKIKTIKSYGNEMLKNAESTDNQKFGSWEQIKKFKLVPEEWSINDGHLTPTMKLKRKVVKEKYRALIEEMYS